MDLETVAGELYRLPPGQFTAARDARAGQARSAGERELAAAIRKLRRPTMGAWLANLLVRERGDQLGRLLDLGAQLRQAQADLAGGDLRRLSRQRRHAVAALSGEARRLGRGLGQPVSEAAVREVEATLEAAVADSAAAAALRSGRLVAALRYSGFGRAGLTGDDGAVPAGEAAPAGEVALAGTEREAARRELRAADGAVAGAEREAARQERRLRAARTERDRRRRQAAELERRLGELRAAEQDAVRDLRDVETAREAAERALRAAVGRAARARAELARLAPPGARPGSR